jgi:hypothetical protein
MIIAFLKPECQVTNDSVILCNEHYPWWKRTVNHIKANEMPQKELDICQIESKEILRTSKQKPSRVAGYGMHLQMQSKPGTCDHCHVNGSLSFIETDSAYKIDTKGNKNMCT